MRRRYCVAFFYIRSLRQLPKSQNANLHANGIVDMQIKLCAHKRLKSPQGVALSEFIPHKPQVQQIAAKCRFAPLFAVTRPPTSIGVISFGFAQFDANKHVNSLKQQQNNKWY